MKSLISFMTGLLFALGLGFSGMTQPHIVKGFLDIFGTWNISLIGVMGGAIFIHAIAYQYIKSKPTPILDKFFYLPIIQNIDKRLVIGASLFGIGWGWAGICPGPGIVSLVMGEMNMIIFVLAMLAGMLCFKLIEKRIS